MEWTALFMLLLVVIVHETYTQDIDDEEKRAKEYIKYIEKPLSEEIYKKMLADWDYESDLTDAKQAITVKMGLAMSKFRKEIFKNVTSFTNYKKYKDVQTKRLLQLESVLGVDILEESKLETFAKTMNEMKKIYSTAKICNFSNPTQCDFTLDNEINEILATSRNYEELEHTWMEWHKASGGKMLDLYPIYVDIFNEGARANGLRDTSDLWLRPYENDFMRQHGFSLYGQIKPLYEELQAYVRYRLRMFYGVAKMPKSGLIPAHLLGNMWGQNWGSIGDVIVPYKDVPNLDVTEAMNKNGYTVMKMFKDAEEFFVSLGMPAMIPSFWKDSIFEKPVGKEVVCHPQAWDFGTGKDFRIKMCTKINMKDYITVHHEMGHVHYYMAYKDQLCTFRDGANEGFHEAAGDVISLSVMSVKRLKAAGLVKNFKENKEGTINFLFQNALKMFVDLPFALTLDQWRWDVFSGRINQTEYNCHWWKLREEFQGMTPPKQRTSKDFDPGGKFHVPSSVPYFRYFTARILTYQFHEALCKLAGEFDPTDSKKPLYKCDIHGSKKAGAKFAEMLKMGVYRPWPETLSILTGKGSLDAAPIINYYKPLYEWLQTENRKNGEQVGWSKPEVPSCIPADK